MSRQSFAVLITRPEPQASRFAVQLSARFGAAARPVLAPLMRAVLLPFAPPPGPFAAVILTSETGAMAAAGLAAQIPRAFCVGDRTAEAARAQGFAALAAGGDAAALAQLILSQPEDGPLLYLHGEDRAADLAALLPGRRVTAQTVYRQEAQPLSTAALDLLNAGGRLIVPLFSPRSARLFAAQVPPEAPPPVVVTISDNTRAALPERLAAGCVVADHPGAAAMLQAIEHTIADLPT